MMTPPAARLALVLLSCVVWMLYSCADGLTDLSGSTNSGPTCDTGNGWTLHGSHCYKKMETTNGWIGAYLDCLWEGGDLVSFTDENEQDFVKGQMGDKPFWIGLSNLVRPKC
ncbi:lactose-binding lectin l-2-like [Syngnathus acus]|uniref:lactose-binding lectin l-2-like n=1 Tax=Syngnathus acus TaxID=161584 RepID=UPI001886486B|nr:lactose-binding lectin l-2-like [Syngnathus acus]